MGTRGIAGFRVDEQDKIHYIQFDSYPGGVGLDVFKIVHSTSDKELVAMARRVTMISGKRKPSQKQIEHCLSFTGLADLGVSEQSVNDWYCLLRRAQGRLEWYKKNETVEQEIYAKSGSNRVIVKHNTGNEPLKYMLDGGDFPASSLFCEWGWIINVDAKILECYKGFNENPNASGRYAHLQKKPGDKHYGISFIAGIVFEEARRMSDDEFLALFKNEEEDE